MTMVRLLHLHQPDVDGTLVCFVCAHVHAYVCVQAALHQPVDGVLLSYQLMLPACVSEGSALILHAYVC